MAESAGPGTKVQFVEAAADGKPKTKNQPTQRYDRKEIQKRLDIENWMEQQLKDLYECQVSYRSIHVHCTCVCSVAREKNQLFYSCGYVILCVLYGGVATHYDG